MSQHPSSYKPKHPPHLNRVLSEEALGSHSRKDFATNIPFPQLVGKLHPLKLSQLQDMDSVPPAVQEVDPTGEQDRPQPQTTRHSSKKLPHFTVFDDKGEFNQKQPLHRRERCNSVGQLKIVSEEKKETEPKEVSKLIGFVDNNEFNHMSVPDRKVEVMDDAKEIAARNYHESVESIKEIEQPKEEAPPHQKTHLESELDSLVVDEVDKYDKKLSHLQERKEEEAIQPIEEEAEEEAAIEKLEMAKDHMLQHRLSLKKHISSEPITAQVTELTRQNLVPFAAPIAESQEATEES